MYVPVSESHWSLGRTGSGSGPGGLRSRFGGSGPDTRCAGVEGVDTLPVGGDVSRILESFMCPAEPVTGTHRLR